MRAMSALPPKPELRDAPRPFRDLPIAELIHRSKQQPLLDHLVGAGDQDRRHVNSDGLGGLEVDDECELCRLLDR